MFIDKKMRTKNSKHKRLLKKNLKKRPLNKPKGKNSMIREKNFQDIDSLKRNTKKTVDL